MVVAELDVQVQLLGALSVEFGTELVGHGHAGLEPLVQVAGVRVARSASDLVVVGERTPHDKSQSQGCS